MQSMASTTSVQMPVAMAHTCPAQGRLTSRALTSSRCLAARVIQQRACRQSSRLVVTQAAAEAASELPPQQKIRIKLKGYSVQLLRESVEQILGAANNTGRQDTLFLSYERLNCRGLGTLEPACG